MVNIDDFVKRLEMVMDYYSLNASAFADKIGVQRSSMSHLLSGRNKPSLDFIMKIMQVFPEVDLYWILMGKGIFPKNYDDEISKNTESASASSNSKLENETISSFEFNRDEKNKLLPSSSSNFDLQDEEIEKIVLFYKNGTFKAFSPD